MNHLTDVWTSDRTKITIVIIYSSLFESFNVETLLKFYIKVKVLLLLYELVKFEEYSHFTPNPLFQIIKEKKADNE